MCAEWPRWGAGWVQPNRKLGAGACCLTRSPFSCHQEAAAGVLTSKEERSPQTLTPAGEDAVKTPSPAATATAASASATATEEAGEPETKGNS